LTPAISGAPGVDDPTGGSDYAGGTGESAENDPVLQFTGSGIAGADIQTEVILDGKRFTANIDTGLEFSTLNSEAAKAVFGVTAASPGSAPAATISNDKLSGETVTVYGAHMFAHTFHA